MKKQRLRSLRGRGGSMRRDGRGGGVWCSGQGGVEGLGELQEHVLGQSVRRAPNYHHPRPNPFQQHPRPKPFHLHPRRKHIRGKPRSKHIRGKPGPRRKHIRGKPGPKGVGGVGPKVHRGLITGPRRGVHLALILAPGKGLILFRQRLPRRLVRLVRLGGWCSCAEEKR